MPKGKPLTAEARAEKEQIKNQAAEAKAAEKAEKKRLADEEKRGRAAVTERQPDPGDNSQNMNGAERQQLFVQHADHWSRCEKDVRAAIKRREEVEKIAKEDGFPKKTLVAAAKFEDPKKHAKLKAEMRMIAQVAVWMGAPLNFQFNMFGEPDNAPMTDGQVTDKAYAEGKAASASNQSRRVPVHYPPGSEAFNAWLSGFDDHQKELGQRLGRGAAGTDAGAGVTTTGGKNSFAEKNAATIAEGDRIARGEAPTSGTAITRSAYNAAGGETAAQRLAREQGVDEQDDDE